MFRETVPVGTIGLSKIGGLLGWLIARGQSLTGDPSWWTHAFVVIDDERVLEAMPNGAQVASLSQYLARPDTVFLRYWYELGPDQETRLTSRALELVGTPYGFSDYLSLVIPRRLRPSWLERYISSNRRLICSQLADELLRDVGVELFSDGRPPHDVTPGDLLREWALHIGR